MHERTLSEWRRFPLDGDLPLSEAVRSGQPLFLDNKATLQARYPALREANQRAATESWLALPLLSDRLPIGGLAFGFAQERSFNETDRTFAIALAQQCTQALERTRLYEAERVARARADEANRAKSEFLAVMSHELRTPLNAIAGYAELLEMGIHGQLTPPQLDAMGRIRRSQRHLLGLINDVLSFARIDAGHVDLEIEDVSLHQLALSLEPLVEPQFRRKGLRYRYDVCEAGLTVRADAEKLRQILLNLLSNAMKFTDTGGLVTVSCGRDGDRAAIAIRDSGRGIPADKVDRIFEPFVQLEAGHTRTHDGTGLGLAISRDLARVMHGEITVESEPGVGSTFTVMLPGEGPEEALFTAEDSENTEKGDIFTAAHAVHAGSPGSRANSRSRQYLDCCC